MKSLSLILFFLIALSATAQVKAPETDFVLKHGKVTWQHKYEIAGMTADSLLSSIIAKATEDPRNSDPIKVENNLTFVVNNDKQNIKKYGGKEMKTSIIAQLYMKYEVSVTASDSTYVVSLKEIFVDNKDRTERKFGEISKFICNTSNLTFKDDPAILKGLTYIDKHFLDRFDVRTKADVPKMKKW